MPRHTTHPCCALQPGSACCALLEAQSITSAGDAVSFSVHCLEGSGGHVYSGTANLWVLDSQNKETDPEILCSAVRVCTALLEYSPALDKVAEAPLHGRKYHLVLDRRIISQNISALRLLKIGQ